MLRGFYHDRVVAAIGNLWRAFACALANFLDEAAFRLVLASCVIAGRMPRQEERRWWNRAVEAPVLIDVLDCGLTTGASSACSCGRRWSLRQMRPPATTESARAVMRTISRGAADMSWSTRFETDYGLKWDHERQVRTARDGFAYDGQRDTA
jgi:hypothetical protein